MLAVISFSFFRIAVCCPWAVLSDCSLLPLGCVFRLHHNLLPLGFTFRLQSVALGLFFLFQTAPQSVALGLHFQIALGLHFQIAVCCHSAVFSDCTTICCHSASLSDCNLGCTFRLKPVWYWAVFRLQQTVCCIFRLLHFRIGCIFGLHSIF